MLIFPEIQISEGRVVTRISPSAANVVHDISPAEAARRFVEEGAERLHILDVDAALGGGKNNEALIRDIIAGTDIPVQVAGGMRTVHQIDAWLEAGAAQVVLGTLAITNQPLLAEVCTRHPGAILANIATKDGYVMIYGWQTQTAFRPQDIVYALQMAGVAGIIHFDIDRLQGEAATSLALTMEMKQDVVIPVYSSGTVHTLDDVARLRYLPNIHGVIIGRALLENVFSLQEALDVARQGETSPEPEVETAVSVRGIQQARTVYLAAYNLSQASRWWNQDLRQIFTDDNPYVEMLIPQEDLDVDPNAVSRRELQAAYEDMLDRADALVVMLDGIGAQAWTGFECGYARARGKFLLGVADTTQGEGESAVGAMCDDIVYFEPEGERHTLLDRIAKEVNSRLISVGVASRGSATVPA